MEVLEEVNCIQEDELLVSSDTILLNQETPSWLYRYENTVRSDILANTVTGEPH